MRTNTKRNSCFWNFLGIVGFGVIFALCNDVDIINSPVSNTKTQNLSKHPVLLLISFDGFRFNFFDRVDTPALDLLRTEGVSVPYMRNQFVTKTFTNHMSIVTGLHAESHGVVDNQVFDPKYNKTFGPESDLFWNYNSEMLPLWTLNELAGDGRRSGAMMWPGSDHPFGVNNVMKLPSRVEKWNDSIPFKWRIDRVLEWITDEKDPVNLAFLYFEEPDEFAHALGPESPEVADKIKNLDAATGYLIQQLKANDLFNKVNIMLFSDHGFAEVEASNMINISSFVNPMLYERHGSTPVFQLLPKEGKFNEIYKTLQVASKTHNFSVYTKEEISHVKGWFYANNRRILDIIVVADLGFVFEDFAESIKYYDSHFNRTPSINNKYGVHGYDSHNLLMHPFFIGHGPIFKKKFVGSPFDNIDIFPLVCRITGIDVPSNNGTYDNVKTLIITQGFAVGSPVGWAVGAGIIFGIMILFGIMSILASSGRERHQSRRLLSSVNNVTYRYINRRGSCDSADENENFGTLGPTSATRADKEESQALLHCTSSTEEV